jgi:DNA repair ATPase RecN
VTAPGAVPILDWFHIAMRLTRLDQYTRGLAHHNPVEAAALESRLERIKWRLWHGDADDALTRVRELAEDVAALDSGYPKLKRLARAAANLATYIANNAAALPDYSERWSEPHRVCRRPFGLSHAAMVCSSSMA